MHILKGHWRDDQGLMTIGTLLVEKKDGNFIVPDTGSRLYATAYAYCSDEDKTAVEITGPHVAWYFAADRGECERIGMPVS